MKKTLFAAIAFALFATASAQAVEVTTRLGATTNYVSRGVSQANDGSVSAGIRATSGGFFGDVETITLQDRSNLKSIASVGYTTKFLGADVTGGYIHRFYTGNGAVTNDRNFGEAFAKVNYAGLNAFVGQTISPTVTNGHNTYTRVGYTAPEFHGFTADVGTAYTHYRNEGVTRHTNTEASLSYNVLKNVKVVAAYSIGGKNVAGKNLANQTSVAAVIGF